MLIDLNLQDSPLLMFLVAVVIVAAIFLFLAGVFAAAEAIACLFEKRWVSPAIFSWFVSCGVVFLANLGFAAVFPGIISSFEQKKAFAFIHSIEDTPFYIGVPAGMIAVFLIAILINRNFDSLMVRTFWRAVIAALSAVTMAYVMYGLLLFMRSFDIFSIVKGILALLASDIGRYLMPGLVIAGLFYFNFLRLTRHARYFVEIDRGA